MRIQKIVGLTLALMLFVTLVFADVIVPGGRHAGPRWPAQRIQFSNISSLGKFKLHLQNYEENYIGEDIIITRDTTYFIPEHGGSPTTGLRLFALLNKKSTDTVEINYTDKIFNLIPIKNNKLQFARKPKKGFLSMMGDLNNSDNVGNGIERISFNGMNKLLLVFSLSAFAGLFVLFVSYKKKNLSNVNGNPLV